MLIAASNNNKEMHALYEKVFWTFFSRAKMGVEDKLAFPAECLWTLNDIKWVHKQSVFLAVNMSSPQTLHWTVEVWRCEKTSDPLILYMCSTHIVPRRSR